MYNLQITEHHLKGENKIAKTADFQPAFSILPLYCQVISSVYLLKDLVNFMSDTVQLIYWNVGKGEWINSKMGQMGELQEIFISVYK